MTLLKIIFAVMLGVAALTVVGKIRQKAAASPSAKSAAADNKDPGLSAAGFFLLSRDDAKNPRVTIMSPPNCPSEEAARAQMLAGELAAAGIPTEMKQEIGFEFHDPADVERVNKYSANSPNPLVIVRGWAKGNPTARDVIAQYQSGK